MSKIVLPAFTLEEVRIRLESGIGAFLNEHAALFEVDVAENALSAELFHYLKAPFAPWDVNSQYNSFGEETKRSPIPSRYLKPRKYKLHPRGHAVTPDIIVHKRKHPLLNLLAIEAKKENDADGIVEDREKLRSYQGPPLRYPYVAILLYCYGDEPSCRYELFNSGENPQIAKEAVVVTKTIN